MMKQWAGLVLVGAIIVGRLAAPASAPSPPVVQVQTSAAVDLSDTGGVQMQVESLVLSAGSWTITSNLTAIDFGSGDFVRCHLQAGATDIDGGATVFLADRVAGIVNAGTVVASKKVTIGLFCDHDKNAHATNQFYIDSGATITAVEGGPIEAPGLSASKPKVVEARTTSTTPLSDSSYGAVTSVTLSKGKWALKGNGSAINFGDFDYAHCYMSSSAGSVSLNVVEAGNESADAAATDIDLEAEASVPAGGATATLYCKSEFTNGVYIDAGATLTATKTAATVVQIPENMVISDTGGMPTTMASQTMPAGSWRITGAVGVGFLNPDSSWGGNSDFVRCELQAGKHIIGSGQTQLITEDANIQQIVNSATYTSSGSWTLKEVCSHDTTNTDPGHWSADVGNLIAINQGPIG